MKVSHFRFVVCQSFQEKSIVVIRHSTRSLCMTFPSLLFPLLFLSFATYLHWAEIFAGRKKTGNICLVCTYTSRRNPNQLLKRQKSYHYLRFVFYTLPYSTLQKSSHTHPCPPLKSDINERVNQQRECLCICFSS